MHLLPCPTCQASITVSPSQAGDQLNCPSCQSAVDIPKLGQLRQLPRAEADRGAQTADRQPRVANSSGRQATFAVFGVIATISLFIAGFCAIRWYLVDVPMTTERHIAKFKEEYKKLKPAELIREYEQMERFSLDITVPFEYKKEENKRNRWRRNALVSGAVCGIASLCALALLITGGRNPHAPMDT
ncbi:MAG: hypothetical protein MI861_08900 [Pirellulales bacterium]|nr:hypothetical protein [Pirellulales bacterium]